MNKDSQSFDRLIGYFYNRKNMTFTSRASWGVVCLTVIIIIIIQLGRSQGTVIPIPFLMVYGSVVLAALVGGLRFGLASGVIASGFIVYSGIETVGPPTLTGGIIPISFGIGLHIISVILVGRVRDQRQKLLLDIATLLDERTLALKDNETMMQNILDYSPALIYLRDLEGYFILANQKYESETKYTLEQIKGKTAYDIFTKEAADLFFSHDQRIIETQEAYQFEETISKRNGIVKTYLTSLFPVYDSLGEMTAVGGISTNITERKQAEIALRQNEERYRQVLEAVSDFAYLMRVEPDKSVHFEWLTGNPEIVVGYTNDEFIDGSFAKLAFDIIHVDFHKLLQQSLETLLSNKRTQIEVMCRHKNGSDVWLRISRQPIWDANEQRVTRYYASIIDITQEKKAEETLIDQEILKVELEKEKDLRDLRNRYLSTIAHDFRTPLASIIMANDILENYSDKLTEDKKQAQRQRITRSVEYLDKMLEELSLIARVERGYLEFNPILLSPKTICTQIVNDFITIHEDAYKIVLEFDDSIDKCCLDVDMLGHILLNLLSNAIKYSPKGSTIILRLSKQNDNLVIDVIDEGIGIPEEDQTRLFEPFHRAKNVGSVKGSGIGLSIVKEFVLAHDGEISYTSTLGIGTTFTLSIPIEDNDCGNDDSLTG